MRARVVYLSDPFRDVTPLERIYCENQLGRSWDDDLDYGIIVATASGTPYDLLGDQARGHRYCVELPAGRQLWLVYHA